MPKFKTQYLSGLLLLLSINAAAQFKSWQFGSKYTNNYALASIEINDNYFQKTDSIFLWVKSVEDVRLFINKGYANKVFAIKLDINSQTGLNQSLALFSQFTNLKYLNFWITGAEPDKNLKLPGSIESLQQLEGVEFNLSAIDMDDALKKLAGLKNLHVISFSKYTAELPPSIARLTQIDSIELHTTNISNNNLKGIHWKKVHVIGNPAVWKDSTSTSAKEEEKALLSLASVGTLKQVYFDDIRFNDPSIIKKFTQVNDLRGTFGGKDNADTFFKALSTLKNIHTLYLDLVYVHSISISWLKNMTQLKDLYLGSADRPFKDLEALGELTDLESLTLHQCALGAMPDIFTKLTHLKTLGLTLNGITKVPPGMFNLPALENLELMQNRITFLPPLVSYGCTRLKRVNLMLNQLTSLPQAFSTLPELETINCSNNKIETIPGGWGYLTHLKEVNFAINHLTEFPEGLQNNHSVERITLFFNNIAAFPDVDGEGYKLKFLGITGNRNMFALPEHIGAYTELETLKAEYLNLKALPESLGNCKKLKELLLSRTITAKCALPAGLKDAKDLELLELNDNPLLDQQSIFDVIFSTPRKNFRVNLSADRIRQLPASKKWATTPFKSLSLRNNLLTTLPVQFSEVPILGQIDITGNDIAKDLSTKFTAIRNKEDMKIIFEMLGVALPSTKVSKTEYAKSLTYYSINFGNADYWQKAVDFANKAMATDSATYAKNTLYDVIGICRYHVKDYKGAINDFDKAINQVKKQGRQPGNPKDVRHFKGLAYMALNQPKEAAKAFATMSSVSDFIEAAKICTQMGNKKLYQQLLDTALLSFKIRMDWNDNRNYEKLPDFFLITSNPNTIRIDYATMLLLAGKPADALAVLNKVSPITDWYPQEPSVKYFLVAATNYLLHPESFDSIKSSLSDNTSKNGKITTYNLVRFDDWLPYTDLSEKHQQDLLSLQNIAK